MKGLTFSRIAFILFALGLFLYGNAVFHPFVHDDVVFIQNNPKIGNLQNLAGIFLKPTVSLDAPEVINAYYRPLLEVFYRIEFRLFNLRPAGYHFINVVIHILNSILVYRLIDLFVSRRVGFIAAIAFLVHPVQSEAVACVAGISNLLYALFFLAGFLFYLLSKKGEEREWFIFYILSLAAFSAGLLAKEQTIVFPLVIAAYEICFRRDQSGKKNALTGQLLKLSGFFFLGIGYLTWRQALLPHAHLLSVLQYKSELFLRLWAVPKTLLIYLKLLIVPFDLHYYRSLDVLEPAGVFWIVLLFLVTVVIVLIRRLPEDRRPVASFALCWVFITLLPTLNILPLIIEYSHIMTAEHFLYLPVMGFFLFCGVMLSDINVAAYAIIFLFWAGTTVYQNTFWRGEIPLFERTLKFEPQLGRVHVLLAKAYYLNHQYKKAAQEFETSLQIMQRYLEKARPEEAKNFYRGFIKGIHFDLAHCYEALGLWERAIAEYKEALKLGPHEGTIYNNLGSVYLQIGDVTQAQMDFEKAIQLDSRDVMSRNNLAICYIQEGRKEEARDLLKGILAVSPHFPAAEHNLNRLIDSGATP